MDASSRVDFNKDKGILSILDKTGKIRLAYSAPSVRLSTNKTVSLGLDWDVSSSTLNVNLPDKSFPLVLAFGLGVPDAKGGFDLSLPRFKLGGRKRGDGSESESESESEEDTVLDSAGIAVNAGVPEFEGQASIDINVDLDVEVEKKKRLKVLLHAIHLL